MHGIPVLLKDNIATRDRMQTTAGSLALVGSRPTRDAHLVSRLRDAGAVILGKTNLSEWANIRSQRSTSGWSARGGLTLNPYALDRNTSGSSSGSASAIAASLAAVAIGTETDGSITSPASMASLVGIKPTVGLVSRAGIIPIAHSQDTAGPMTRNVADAALLLPAIAGSDARDRATVDAHRKLADYTRHLDRDGLKGKRIGVVRGQFASPNDLVAAVVDEHRLDALVAPTGGLAWLTDFIKGDAESGSFTSQAAVAGYPHINRLMNFLVRWRPNRNIRQHQGVRSA